MNAKEIEIDNQCPCLIMSIIFLLLLTLPKRGNCPSPTSKHTDYKF